MLVERGVSTVPASPVSPLAPVGVGRVGDLRMLEVEPLTPSGTRLDVGGTGLRMVGVALSLVLRVMIERLATL